ncbi:MAG: hypothetical protein ALECFALPRED_003942 [Alectoria fallacina]|uniref:Myb-like DNA-binding domain protein n=1 Tax=Alectoria fallacina TaxID=1903189 RepID=A0A8H3FLA1_9LECA|nr:MAG: hypothetical protein ALECFALPRED_003942 [Alectoria fallacina]
METPSKKRRLSGSSYPEIDLHARRAQNDFRLKSIFESIFEKYGKDFDGIGDEIDMETGEIVVNNGHILGMTNERDVGDAGGSSEELGSSDDDGEHSSTGYSEEHVEALRPYKTGDVAVMEEPQVSEHSDFDADSLIGDVPAESHLGKKSRRAVSIPTDDEEDELASSDIEWASHSKDVLGARKHWCFHQDKPTFADEPAIEPAWRAPPLPKIALFETEREDVELTSVDDMRCCSDDERAGISLWTPEVNKRPRRRRESASSTSRRSRSFARGQENNAGGTLSDLSNSEPVIRKIVKWTHAEEELLILLKTTTNLSGPAMEPYFPGRQGNVIGSHWNYMITHGKASPKSKVPKRSDRGTLLSSLSPSINSLAPDGTRQESPNQDTISRANNPQTVQQQQNVVFPETGSLVRSSSRALEQLGDPQMKTHYRVGCDHGSPSGYTVENPILISGEIGSHIGYMMGEPFSSAKDCETKEDYTMDGPSDGANEPSTRTSDHYHLVGKVHNRSDQSSIYMDQGEVIRTKRADSPEAFVRSKFDNACHVNGGYKTADPAYQAKSHESYANTNQSRCLSKSLEIKDDIVMRSLTLSSQGLEAVSENGCENWVTDSTASIKAEPDFKGGDPIGDSTVPLGVYPRSVTTIEALVSPHELETKHSRLPQEDSITRTAEDVIQTKRSTAEGRQKTRPTNLVSTASAQPPTNSKRNASQEPNVRVTSNTFNKRQIVQVVIPLAATSNVIRKSGGTEPSPLSHPHTKSLLANVKTEDSALIRQLSATAESTPAASSPDLPDPEILVIRTPTRSPSAGAAAAESQYAASASFVLNDVRSSLGPEIADSQPLSTTPAIPSPALELEGEATNPIILDTESQSSRMAPGVAPSERKNPKKATKTINLDSDPRPLRLTPGSVTLARNRVEEATESNIVECGSRPLSMRLSAARSRLKKVKKEIIADSFSSIWTAIDDYSEDELSYL